MKVILAHDSFTIFGGAERVVEAMHEAYPDAPVYTLVVTQEFRKRYPNYEFVVSPLQWLFNWYPRFQHLFPFIPMALSFFRTEKADMLISSSSSYIKGLVKPAGGYHINYCHTPTRFLWHDRDHAFKEIHPWLHPFAKLYMAWLQQWDYKVAKRVDYFIANSKEVQERIQKIYNRDSVIIYPFVRTDFWRPTKPKEDYFLIAGRLQYAKGLDTVVETFNELGTPLHVVGSGRYEEYLKSIAKPNIKFLGAISDEGLRDEYSGARGYIYPQLEDFGIMPLEAAACGTPTLGLAKGGSLETIIPGVTGELMEEFNHEVLKQHMQTWDERKYSLEAMQSHAKQFSKERFISELKNFVSKVYASRH